MSSKDIKSVLVVALRAAEIGIDGLPIPGVKGCISGILKIIEQEELREANIEAFKSLIHKVAQFEKVAVVRLSKERNIPETLKSDVQDLAKKLNDIPARYNETIADKSKMRRFKNLILASTHAEALNNLVTDLQSAIEEFQTALLVNMQLGDLKREADRLIDKLPVEPKSFHNAYREHQTELCEQDTRVSLLEDVAEWAESTNPNHRHILWLNGRAGTGKSTVAKTLATRFNAGKILGGSFMFSKPNGVTDGSKVFTTLACQLARHLPEFRHHLVDAIRANEDSIRAEMPQQFEDLLAAPLSHLQSPPVTVIILDALDECAAQPLTTMLTLIVKNIERFPCLRIILTSRPENPIREILHSFAERVRQVDMSDIPTAQDIETYLRRRLNNSYSRLVHKADQNQVWPADEDLQSLVGISNNLFIFAATAVRFIGDERMANPQSRLEIILRGQHVGRKHPFSTLDVVYREILRNALPEGEDDLHERFQAVVGTIVLSSTPFSVNELEELLAPNYTASDIRHSLNFLHSVIIAPEEDDEPLRVYHKSFADFMTDPERCTLTEAYLRPPTHHERLCLRHLEMAELEFDTLSSGTFTMNGWSSGFLYALAVGPILYTTLDSLELWLYHCSALKHQKLEGNDIAQVIQVVSHRVQAFLDAFGRYQWQFSRAMKIDDKADDTDIEILRTKVSSSVALTNILICLREKT